MNDAIDFSTLKWVKKELDDTLKEAREALETYAADQDDEAQVGFLAAHLHQVYGTLQMVELYGASLLAEEMEQTALALQRGEIAQREDAHDVLMRAIVQLPDYLDRLIAGHRDIPLVLLPLLNDLRAVRGQNLLSESSMFSPDLDASLPVAPAAEQAGDDVCARARELRHRFQLGLLGWFRGVDTDECLGSLAGVLDELASASAHTAALRLWWVAAGLVDALREGALDNSIAVKRLLGQVDRCIKHLIDEGETGLIRGDCDELLKNLLFYVGQATGGGERVCGIRSTYRLDDLLPGDEELAAARESLAGQNSDLFRTVASAVKEELGRLKDSLDIVLRGGCQDAEELRPMAQSLRALSDTLGMLGLGAPRAAVMEKADGVQQSIEQGHIPPETLLMDIASTLLFVESSMDRMAQGQGAEVAMDSGAAVDEQLAASEFDQVKQVVLNEAIADLARAKESISEFTETKDVTLLRQVPALLGQVKGGLLLLDEASAATLIDSLARYVAQNLLDEQREPSETELDSLADAICGIEYFLEGRREHRMYGHAAMDIAEQRVESLGFPPVSDDAETPVAASIVTGEAAADSGQEASPPSQYDESVGVDVVATDAQEDEVAPELGDETAAATPSSAAVLAADEGVVALPVIGDDVDEEILEIFIEEAEEEIASIREQLPRWLADAEDKEALATMRRSYHTLKGSGRLVGAMCIGEFAWAFENMLNRVIDGTVSPQQPMIDILQQALDALPELVKQIQQGTPVSQPVAWLMASAEALSAGKALPARPEAVAAGNADDSTDYVEPVLELEATCLPADEVQEMPAARDELDVDELSPEGDDSLMDGELYGIFNAETRVHLDVIQAFLDSGEHSATEDLARALHTLHGSAHMAEAEAIARLSGELEKYVKALLNSDLPASEEGYQVLAEGASMIALMLDGLPAQNHEPTAYRPLLARIAALQEVAAAEALHAAAIDGSAPAQAADGEQPEPAMAEPLAPADSGAYSECDPELLEIFLEEGAEILERSDAELHAWRAAPANAQALAGLQRELHTLKGGARMADIPAIGNLAHAVESLIGVVAAGGCGDAGLGEALDCVQQAHDRLVAMLDRVRHREPLTAADALVDSLDAIRLSCVAEAEQDAARPQTAGCSADPELLEVFLEEADDILEHSATTLQHWKQAPQDKTLVAELQRELHTLKGGARMADITAIGDLAHAFEALMGHIEDTTVQTDATTFSVLEQAHDRLVEMVNQVRENKPLAGADALRARMEALRHDSEEPAPEAQAGSPANTDIVLEQVDSSEQAPKPERRAVARAPKELVRVRAELLDNLVNFAGEVSIYRSRLEQQVGAYRFNLAEMEQTVVRLREQLRKLEIETEAQILFRYEKEIQESGEDFDPLEMDRYSTLQQLSRSLVESVSDLDSIQNLLENITRESETLLLQQSRVNTELQEGLMRTRMVPFLGLAPRMRRIVRQTCQHLGKKAELELAGAEGEMDRTVIDRIIAPIEHMLRNAISHGIEVPEQRLAAGKPEAGSIHISLARESSDVVLRIADDGAGIDLEAIRSKAIERGLLDPDAHVSDNEVLQYILETGFSTAEQVTQIAGRGVGMDVVNSEVKQLGGSLHIDSVPGHGTTFTIRLPFTLAVNQALLVEIGDDPYAIPLSSIQGIVRMRKEDLQAYYDDPAARFEYGGFDYEVRHLGSLLGTHKPALDALPRRIPVLLVRSGEHAVALQVERLMGSREIVVKSVGPQISTVRGVSGATILGDGSVVMILDVAALLRGGTASVMSQVEELLQQPMRTEGLTVMVVDDSITVRKVTSRLLERNDMTVITAKDGVDAVSRLQEHIPDVMLLDIEMPRMDGFELATHVRNEPRLKHIPIVMITSRTGDKHRRRAMEIGVNRYLGKPFQESELLETIQDVLEEARADG